MIVILTQIRDFKQALKATLTVTKQSNSEKVKINRKLLQLRAGTFGFWLFFVD